MNNLLQILGEFPRQYKLPMSGLIRTLYESNLAVFCLM